MHFDGMEKEGNEENALDMQELTTFIELLSSASYWYSVLLLLFFSMKIG